MVSAGYAMDDFEHELKMGFLEEATQLLSEAEQCFLIIESSPNDTATLEKLFRIAHNIKGSSKAVGFDGLGAFTHEFETFMLKCKSGQIPIRGETISLLLRCNDHIKQFIDLLKSDVAAVLDSASLIAEIQNFQVSEVDSDTSSQSEAPPEAESSDPISPEPAEENISPDEIQLVAGLNSGTASTSEAPSSSQVGSDFLDIDLLAREIEMINQKQALSRASSQSALIQAEAETLIAEREQIEGTFNHGESPETSKPSEIKDKGSVNPNNTESQAKAPEKVSSQPTRQSQAGAPPSSGGASAAPLMEETIRVSLSRLEKLLNFVGELVIMQTVLREQAFSPNPQVLRKTIHQMGKVTKEVQDLSMSLRMVPLKQTFQKMQRIVRDTSALLGKKVQLVVQGEETEVDKTVLEALSDPLVHLIRNAVDHGIESPSERVAKGKSEVGQVTLRAYHESGKLVIEVKDNGGGMSSERLKKKAVEKGILKQGQTISEKDALNLIFHPGFSTKAEVTEVSGRGVGMDVVKTNIEQMQGEVLIETVLNEGSVFKIVLPLTLAIIDGMVVRSGEDRYIIPLAHVHESVKPEPQDLKFATGVGEVLLLRGENLPVVRLSQALGKKKAAKPVKEQIAIIIRTQKRPFAALVDDVVGQHQVVIKKLGAEMQNMKGYSGSAILGDGRPALILELGDLVGTTMGSSPISQNRQGVA